MTPQFVDFDGDGNIDIVAGIFGGSPKLARGDGKHFAQPAEILDKEGARILMNQYWDYEKDAWLETDRCDPEGTKTESHLTSAWAVDWDGDGDLDLLLGDYNASGMVMLRRNEGTRKEPAYATRNELLRVGDKPLELGKPITTLRTIDWNGDGKLDLVVGSKGLRRTAEGEGEMLSLYLGKGPGLQLEAGTPLLTCAMPSGTMPTEATRPTEGFYFDLQDLDGDGDLDILVGGRAKWKPAARELTEAEEAKAAALRTEMAEAQAALEALGKAIEKEQAALPEDASEEERQAPFFARVKEMEALAKTRSGARAKLLKLVPQVQNTTSVWWYENKRASAPSQDAASGR